MQKTVDKIKRLKRVYYNCRWEPQDPLLAEIERLAVLSESPAAAARFDELLQEWIGNQEERCRLTIAEHEAAIGRLTALLEFLPMDEIHQTLTENRDAFLKEVLEIVRGCMTEREERFREEYGKLREKLTAALEYFDTEKAMDAWLLQEAPALLPPVSEQLLRVLSAIPDIFVAATKQPLDRYIAAQDAQMVRLDEMLSAYFEPYSPPEHHFFKVPYVSAHEGRVWANLGLLLAPWIGGKPAGFRGRSRKLPYYPSTDLQKNKDFLKAEWEDKLNRMAELMCKDAREAGDRQLFQIELTANQVYKRASGYTDVRREKLEDHIRGIREECEREHRLAEELRELRMDPAAR